MARVSALGTAPAPTPALPPKRGRASRMGDAAILGATTGLVGYALAVSAITWLVAEMAPTEMPAGVRGIIILAMCATGTGLMWLGMRIKALGG